MSHTRLYIIQFLGIIVLLCGYFLSDRPDQLSLMHFDPAAPSSISKTTTAKDQLAKEHRSFSSHNKSNRRSNVPKYFSLDLWVPVKTFEYTNVYPHVTYAIPLHEQYTYLFYEEINPPPPKDC